MTGDDVFDPIPTDLFFPTLNNDQISNSIEQIQPRSNTPQEIPNLVRKKATVDLPPLSGRVPQLRRDTKVAQFMRMIPGLLRQQFLQYFGRLFLHGRVQGLPMGVHGHHDGEILDLDHPHGFRNAKLVLVNAQHPGHR